MSQDKIELTPTTTGSLELTPAPCGELELTPAVTGTIEMKPVDHEDALRRHGRNPRKARSKLSPP